MKKMTLLFFFWPALCWGDQLTCASSSRSLLDDRALLPTVNLSLEDFAYIAGDYIGEGKIVYSPRVQERMNQQVITKADLEHALSYPTKVENRTVHGRPANPNQYNIMGLAKDGNQVRLGVAFDSREGGRLVVVTVAQTLSDKRMLVPSTNLSKEDFAYIAGDYIRERKIVYSPHVQNHMDERVITRDDVEHALSYPTKVEKRAEHGRPGGPGGYNIVGLGKEGNQVRIGVSLSSQEEGRLVVVAVARTLPNDRMPVSKEDFKNFVGDYIQEGRGIIYTRHARGRMREQRITRDDVRHALGHPSRVGNLNHASGPYVVGKAKDGNQLRLGVSFRSEEGGRLVVVTLARLWQNDQLPAPLDSLPRTDFIRVVGDIIDREKVVYSDHALARMNERSIAKGDVEHALRHPTKVRKTYVTGLTKNGKQLHIGISSASREGERLVVVTVARPLLETLSMADFKSMIREKMVQQKIVYSQSALKLMQENFVLAKDIERALFGRFDIKKENMLPERPSGLDEYTIVSVSEQDKMAIGIAFNNLREMTITGVWRR